MKRRIFIALDLPPELKQRVAETIAQWRWLPIRWLNPESWHITLIPPVYLEDGELESLVRALRRQRFGGPFPVRFLHVTLAPPGIPARMIWLEGETPAALVELKRKLAKAWASGMALPVLRSEGRPLHLHVTLARFEPGELAELESKTRVLGEVDFDFTAGEVVIMESRLRPSGAVYETIATVPL